MSQLSYCPKCGQVLHVGEFPFCPHGRTHLSTIGDEIVGGQVIETMAHEPLTFYSKKAILEEAKRRNLEPRVRYVPGDQHLINWAAGATEKQLRDATVLLSRGSVTVESPVVCETASFTVRKVAYADQP